MYKLLLSFIILLQINVFSQTDKTVEFFPAGLNFLPLRANHQEAKVGVLYYPNSTNLKVDIGNAMDLLKIRFNKNEFITCGIEFMAYAHSMSYNQMRLQIGALDGFFGGDIVYNKTLDESKIKIRMRFMHNSAHLVDGYFDEHSNSWINGKTPIPFTKDFGELLFAYQFGYAALNFRPYLGGQYAVMVRPNILKRTVLLTGIESHYDALNKIFSILPYSFYIAYHFQLAGTPVYQGTSQLQAGIKFGEWDKKGINLYLSYFRGNNIFNEFYNDRVERFGIGFTVDF